jgi:MHS family proline/betaine transporter-like MFS transporter
VLLTLTRLAQGFAVGGEFTATMVFLVEHAPVGQAGLQVRFGFRV